MPTCDKLLDQARRSQNNVRFADVCALAECYGFVFDRQNGSHRQYIRPGYAARLNFQNDKGKAKPYQVRQLLKIIDDLHREDA